jgi:hypothetical protein
MARLAKLKAPAFWLLSSLVIIVISLYIQRCGVEGFFAEPTYKVVGQLLTYTPDPSKPKFDGGTENPNLVPNNNSIRMYNASTCDLIFIVNNSVQTKNKLCPTGTPLWHEVALLHVLHIPT